MYGATKDKYKINNAINKLNILYNNIPETKGCIENINKSDGCGAWCCEQQCPSLLYCEFLNSWNYVIKNWEKDQIINLVKRSLVNYLYPNKYPRGCVFWDKDNKLCSQHETRPLACREYGIVPKEEFDIKYERLKVIYPNIKYQCNLVSTKNGENVTKKDTDRWWNDLKDAEKCLNIKEKYIHDNIGGSYRTYHDHILLYLLGEELLSNLSELRMSNDNILKDKTIDNLIAVLKDHIE